MLQAAVSLLAVMCVIALILRDYKKAAERRREAEGAVFRHLAAALDEAKILPSETAGTEILTGRIGGQRVEFRTVSDTLQLRKLPSLWLMITLPAATGLSAKLDLMMRAAGQASFSNFDRLPDTIRTPRGFPEEALIKTDSAEHALSPEIFRPLLPAFLALRGKELLATPTGVRMVIQLSEADRVRYGVFRQAQFSAEPLRPETVLPLVAALADLLQGLKDGAIDDDRRHAHG